MTITTSPIIMNRVRLNEKSTAILGEKDEYNINFGIKLPFSNEKSNKSKDSLTPLSDS